MPSSAYPYLVDNPTGSIVLGPIGHANSIGPQHLLDASRPVHLHDFAVAAEQLADLCSLLDCHSVAAKVVGSVDGAMLGFPATRVMFGGLPSQTLTDGGVIVLLQKHVGL